MKTHEMLMSHPKRANLELKEVASCIESCIECANACTTCADACTAEQNVQMLNKCIRLNLDCADICQATAKILSRQIEPDLQIIQGQLQVTRMAAASCAEECEKHGETMQHCRVCASTCRNCIEACNRLLTYLPPNVP